MPITLSRMPMPKTALATTNSFLLVRRPRGPVRRRSLVLNGVLVDPLYQGSRFCISP
jgi:hypothetical protein